MDDFSIVIGGKAGSGVETSSLILAEVCRELGYFVYIYRDYPSIIRGGHTFSLIRASSKKIESCRKNVHFLLAMDQYTADLGKELCMESSFIIFDEDSVQSEGIGLPLGKMVQEEKGASFMKNMGLVGAFCKLAGITWEILISATQKVSIKESETNLKIAKKGYEAIVEQIKLERISPKFFQLMTGNEAIGLGLIEGGLQGYLAYPMTPSSSILHFLAENAEKYHLKVVHPESEISVIMMALGMAYAGSKVAVGTSGGGFCLMTEGLSLSGAAEVPLVIVLSQRTGPSTGLPTYTGQTELQCALFSGHGEFCRFIVAPGNPEEAFFWSSVSLRISWKYQIPSIILSDKILSEGVFSFDTKEMGSIPEEPVLLWDKKSLYQRYQDSETGVSAMAFPSERGAVIKVNSYEHDEKGFTIEDSLHTKKMQEKRLRKEAFLLKDIEKYPAIKQYGDKMASTAIICWGSNRGVCLEVAEKWHLRLIQPIVLSPFPAELFRKSIMGIKKMICVEQNATGQLSQLLLSQGFSVDAHVHKYDGRPFSVEELEEAIRRVL